MKPSDKYQSILNSGEFHSDDSQRHAIEQLDELQALLISRTVQKNRWWQRLVRTRTTATAPLGLYFWGGVGRGKTFLMDIFYQCLPFEAKRRLHFHAFMNQIHCSLKQLSDTSNPLEAVAKELAGDMRVLCLDEFVITDIADAMILTGLLKALFEEGVVLVTTSNCQPNDLYRNGLQRARFLPAIDLISKRCHVINLDGGKDYRLLGLRQTHLYTVPHSQAVVDEVNLYLLEHVQPIQLNMEHLNLNGRELNFQFCSEDTIWFSFNELCKTSRSQNDYLEISRLFRTLILTDIEQMNDLTDDTAKRFILLIDVLYDHRVILICSASVIVDQLYQGKKLAFEFERTVSRLIEMQSEQYLTQLHMTQ
jgi:cell division protein ZapE